MTVDEFLDLPDDRNKKQMLIRGRLWERERTPLRSRVHGRLMARVGFLLEQWRQSRSGGPGEVAIGEVFAVLRVGVDGSAVGIDVAYFGPEIVNVSTGIYQGPPALAVEILLPSNTLDEVMNKIEDYLACGVPLTWVLEPRRRTVTVYRPDAEPVLFNVTQTLAGDSAPPGFSCPVAEFFR